METSFFVYLSIVFIYISLYFCCPREREKKIPSASKVGLQGKTFWKIETAIAIFWMYLGGMAKKFFFTYLSKKITPFWYWSHMALKTSSIVTFFKRQLFLRIYVERRNYVYEEIWYLFILLSTLSYDLVGLI